MDQARLLEHYTTKYSNESGVSRIEDIRLAKIPLSRFEAAVKFFPEYFRGGDILEMGAGNGNIARALLARDARIRTYTLGDISPPRLEGLRRNLMDDRVLISLLDAENVPDSQAGKYDAVIMVALIEHLIDPMGAMTRIRKALKPGGFVYLDTPNIARYTQRLKLLAGKFPSTASRNEGLTTYYGKPADLHDQGHLHYFTYRSLSLMLTERCNFSKIVKLGYPGGKIVLGKHIHGLLATVWPELFSELAIVAYA